MVLSYLRKDWKAHFTWLRHLVYIFAVYRLSSSEFYLLLNDYLEKIYIGK